MKETKEILRAVESLKDGEHAVLATVIDVQGSGYRLPGARMIMLADGDTIGTVSGGCLESDVLERARNVLAAGRPEVFTYDTTGDENSVFSMNMGCRGIIRILLEPIDAASPFIARSRSSYVDHELQIMATLVSSESGTGTGCRAFLSGAGEFDTSGLSPALGDQPELLRSIDKFAESGKAYEIEELQTEAGAFEFAFERLEPPISIMLFGAGADAIPIARIVSELGWHMTVYDHRPAYLTSERFPTANDLILQAPDAPVEWPAAKGRTAVVIMTHNYGRDRVILPAALRSGAFYVGALGPKRRTDQLLEELAADGFEIADEELARRLYAPIGLDTGADTPESIALSIVGEIQSVIANRPGGHLRDRKGSIYDRG